MKKHALDVSLTADVRREFAGLDATWAYLDNAGGSFTLRTVIERVAEYMQTSPVQLGAGYALSQQAAARQADAVAALARFINAQHASDIVLGSSSTALTWQAARALRPLLRAGDEIIITVMDHEANRSPWLALRDAGVTVRTWELDRNDLSLSLQTLDALLNEKTRLVCVSQCSNILGRIEPVAEIARRVHAAGARVFVDGVAYAPHRRVDVQALGVDFYVCSLYKIFGPHIGMLYGKREALLELGNINHEYFAADALPYKLQPGGASYELVFGAGGIPAYFEHWSETAGVDPFELIAHHEAELSRPLLEFLDAHPAVTLFGSADANPLTRLPIIAFRHATKRSADIAAALAERQIAVKHGHFHSRRLLEFLDVPSDDGVVRVSFAHYNTAEEVERLLSALNDVL